MISKMRCHLVAQAPPRSWLRGRRRRGVWIALVAVAAASLVYWEIRSSTLQAGQFSWSARQLSFQVAEGPSATIRFPGAGPFDERLGYSRLPVMLERLTAQGYVIDRQARPSRLFARLTDAGLFPIYREKTQAGLAIVGCDASPLCSFTTPYRVYPDFAAVPPLVVQSLLFIENRELLDPRFPYRNPAVEWDRFAFAAAHRLARTVVGGERSPGGSTLATQMEKYRHSPGGRTQSASEKLRQMTSATLRAYLNGNQTLAVRQQIVVDYLNTMPLAAVPSVGEVFGLGDGLAAWFGADFERINASLRQAPRDSAEFLEKGAVFRKTLSLLVAQRLPGRLLIEDKGRRLADLTDSYLRLLGRAGIIDGPLLRAALQARALPGATPQPHAVPSVTHRTTASALRVRLLGLLGLKQFYELERLDLAVETPLLSGLQRETSRTLAALAHPDPAASVPLKEAAALTLGDPAGVTYSFILLERTPSGNMVRVQADSSETPFDVNEGAKLDLGSTAKLRTLITYLELVSELHARYAQLEPASLAALRVHPRDSLSRWAVDYLMRASDRSLPAMLEAAMERRYSASPAEAFFTGGGLHTFGNFRPEDDARIVTVREAFRQSINLPFVRIMRDIVQHLMFASPWTHWVLAAPDLRTEYLRRFAVREGALFVRRFHAQYSATPSRELLGALADRVRRASPAALSMAFRSVVPEADAEALRNFLAARLPADKPFDVQRMYETYEPSRYSLSDRGHIAGVHPLELWTVAFLYRRPRATLDEAIGSSIEARQAAYDWLLRTRHGGAQDRRILSLLEREVFGEIHRRWQRLGYPFDTLVPSYATAIGSSADRPAALAELMGIVVGEGMRQPTVRIRALHFAAGTPFETRMVYPPVTPQRVLAPEIAAVVRRALVDVVEQGTARRLGAALSPGNGVQLAFGGKTGTGDNRFETYGRGGRLLDSRVVSRAATFAFIIGDRYFGTVTAYVHGARAKDYHFTSALPVQVLKALTPALSAHLGVPCADEPVTRILTKASASAKSS